MFNAKYFTYDGILSATYGLMICDFDDSSVIETSAFNPVLNTVKPTRLNRFLYNDIRYDTLPSIPISIISEKAINDVVRREIASWLIGRESFKTLEVHQPDLEGVRFHCVFTETSLIYVNGMCHGFRLNANFDSPFQYGTPTVLNVTGDGTKQTVNITNHSDINDYVYPTVEFSTNAETSGYNISIINTTDSNAREFKFEGVENHEQITVDNELRYIKSNTGAKRLQNFNKNWLRLRKGRNKLDITINGTVKITCPHYIMVGF